MRSIPLTQGQVALVDDADYAALSQHNWCAQKSGATYYAIRHVLPVSEKLGKLKMHHAIIGKPLNGMVTDHIDGNGLNNQRSNLRMVTVRENQQNQCNSSVKRHSAFPGVTLCTMNGWTRWVAGAKINGKRKTLGYFTDERTAYEAYCAATGTTPKEVAP